MKKLRIVVYTSPACPYCQQIKDWLAKHKLEYIEKDVSKNPKYSEELVKKSNQMGIPVTDINGQIIVGFNEEKFKEALK